MYQCPWCGTFFQTFQPNCSNCGGPMPMQPTAAPEAEASGFKEALLLPPDPPRSISNNYAVKLMMTDGMTIAGFVLTIIGFVFSGVGLGLTIGIITAFVGIPLLLIGIGMLAVGVVFLYLRYQEKMKIVNVLRWGQTVRGQITSTQEIITVTINNRHPWDIEYQFQVNGQPYTGKVSTLNSPGGRLQPGTPTYILYMPDAPQVNSLYPHP